MRKLTAGNKKNFTFFVIIIVLIISIFIVCLVNGLRIGKQEYQIEANSLAYDSQNNPVEAKNGGTIKKKWNGKYYLEQKEDNKTKESNLGSPTVSYSANSQKLETFGRIFKVETDGKVSKLAEKDEIDNLQEDKFYKISDRKYLIVGKNIINDNKSLDTSNYLIVVIDKAGNTKLMNEEVNANTINPMIIGTTSFKFDVANEKLIANNNNEIDLKKIVGSTNQYEEKEDEFQVNNIGGNQVYVASSGQAGESTKINSSQTTENTNNSSFWKNVSNFFGFNKDKSNGNDGKVNNGSNQNSGLNGGNIGNGSQNAGSNNSGSNEREDLQKAINLKGLGSGSTYIDVNYSINDPENKYQTVYVLVTGGSEKTIALDKNRTNYRITGLEPNKDYTVTLGYKSYDDTGTLVDTVQDVEVIRTNRVATTLAITRVSGTKITFNFKMDPNYAYDSGDIVLYVDGKEESRKALNTDAATSANGWTDTLDYKYGQEVTVKLENAMYNGERVETNTFSKFENY